MAVIAMDSFKQSVGQDTALYIRLQIYPPSNLSAVQWRLLYNGEGTVRIFGGHGQQHLPLIGSITEKITLKQGTGDFKLSRQ